MVNNNIRDYDVSLWTLQDSFIATLKGSGLNDKGRIQEPKMTLKDDGTEEFSFSVPMYYYEADKRVENPNWHSIVNGPLIVDMRKIKVIFNRGTDVERVFEFLITQVEERHENGELICEVQCEGLAFHELGKVGYKIELNQENYIKEWGDWSTGEDKDNADLEPHNNINYWLDLVLKDTNWTYSVQMDWSAQDGRVLVSDGQTIDLALPSEIQDGFQVISYSSLTPAARETINHKREQAGLRRCDKIYEEEYVASWSLQDGSLVPSRTEAFREKYRLLDKTESNIYNLTREIAETFEVYCQYIYHYDANYHIIGREIVFYNNFMQEATGTIDITYPYTTHSITRSMDSTDLVTKMYVKTLNDTTTDSGWASIAEVEANRSGEDYLLNFDYLYRIGTITQEQYDEIDKYEAALYEINHQITPLNSQLIALQQELPEVSSKATTAKNSMRLDDERISATDDLLNNLTEGTGILTITNENPETCFVMIDTNQDLYTKIKQVGIIQETIHLYQNFNIASKTLSNEVTSYIAETDEYGNLTGKLYHIPATVKEADALYAIYSYEPQLYYEKIKDAWMRRKAKDVQEYNEYAARLKELDGEKDANGNRTSDGQIQVLEKKLQELYDKKQQKIKEFERMMGPALREGNWQPEDKYSQFGDKYSPDLTLNTSSAFTSDLISIGWDSELFEDEQKNYYEYGVEQEKKYYPCIKLSPYLSRFTDAHIKAQIQAADPSFMLDGDITLESLDFIFSDMQQAAIESPKYFRYFPVNSMCKFEFIRNKSTKTVEPVLMLTGVDTLLDSVHFWESNAHPQIGYLLTTVNEDQAAVKNEVVTLVDLTANDFLVDTESRKILENYEIVYPRIKIQSANVKATDDELSILIENSKLTNYEDYSVLTRGDTIGESGEEQFQLNYYLTIKPDVIVRTGRLTNTFRLNCCISNAALIIYLDAQKVLRENAFPKAEYTIDTSIVNPEFTRQAYNCLSKIARINDYDLKFENVRGYITELELDLDKPDSDSITISNYESKFEDIFSTIVAETEEMKKNSYLSGMAANLFSTKGTIDPEVLQQSMLGKDLQYAFDNGKLTIDEENGIWGTSDEGVVAFRGGGIFTATQKDEDGNWLWNTGILPSGINANLITSGQIDTNLIRIYAGSNLKFQLNGKGLYAYKSWLNEHPEPGSEAEDVMNDRFQDGGILIPGQYVVHNSEGLFLTAKQGTDVLVIGDDGRQKYQQLSQDVNRVEISWDGLIIRNWKNEKVFYADTDGNLTITGVLHASQLFIGDQDTDVDTYVDDRSYNVAGDVLDSWVDSDYTADLNDLRLQADQKAQTWYQPTDPSENWSSVLDQYNKSEKDEHVGDLWLCNDPHNTTQYRDAQGRLQTNCYGKCCVYRKNGSSYEWQEMEDAPLDVLFDTLDGKAQIFISKTGGQDDHPHSPYFVGDLWFTYDSANEEGNFVGEILTCVQSNANLDRSYHPEDWAKRNKYTDDSQFEGWVAGEFAQMYDDLNAQADRRMETWYQEEDPSINWKTDPQIDSEHIHDYWYCTDPDNTDRKEKCWEYQGNGEWKWVPDAPVEGLFDHIDGKSQIFVSNDADDLPYAPYFVGDLWFTYDPKTKSGWGDIMTCVKENKNLDRSYHPEDWAKRNKYTDDTTVNEFLAGYGGTLDDVFNQIDGKAETWYQNSNPADKWVTLEDKALHKGDIWYCTGPASSSYYDRYWLWNGTSWEEMLVNPPKELQEAISQAADIYVGKSVPVGPCKLGDLWFDCAAPLSENSKTCDLWTCTTAYDAGKGSKSNWEILVRYTDDSELKRFLGSYSGSLSAILSQLDKKAQTWYQDDDPSFDWNTKDLQALHVGDIWYCTDSSDAKYGNKYWIWKGSTWEEMLVNPPLALQQAISQAADIYTGMTVPEGPCKKGDLWFKCNPPLSASDPKCDIWTCVTNYEKGKGSTSYWQVLVKYTDDTAVNGLKEEVHTLQNNYNSHFSTVDGLLESVQSNIVNLQKADGTMQKDIAEFESRIKQLPGEITSTVKQWQYGGANILRGTNQALGSTGLWDDGNFTAYQSNHRPKDATLGLMRPPNPNIVHCYMLQYRIQSGNYGIKQTEIPVRAYSNYVISFYAFSSTAEGGQLTLFIADDYGKDINGNSSQNISVSSGIQRYIYYFQPKKTPIQVALYNSGLTGTVTVCGLQLEIGDVATDWTPSPHDQEQQWQSEIQQTASSITATVNSLEGEMSKLEQTASSLKLTVQQNYNDLQNQISSIEIKPDSIRMLTTTLMWKASNSELDANGTLTVKAGNIGSWVIDTNCLYYKNKTFGAAEGVYLGPTGFSVSNIFEVKATSTGTLDKFCINSGGSNNVMLMEVSKDEKGDTDAYELKLGDIGMPEDWMTALTSSIPLEFYTTTSVSSSGQPNFPSDAPNGSLGVLYTDHIDQPSLAITCTTASSGVEHVNNFGADGRDDKVFFGAKWAKRCNVNTGSTDNKISEENQNYGRVGVAHTTSNKSITYGKFTVNMAVNGGSSIGFSVSWKASIGSEWDQITYAYYKRTCQKIGAAIFDTEPTSSYTSFSDPGKWAGNLSETTSHCLGRTTFNTTGKGVSSDYGTASFTIQLTKSLTANKNYYLCFYQSAQQSLVYIKNKGFGNGVKVDTNNYGLYVKSMGQWCKVG